MPDKNDRRSLLRNSLLANALFSTVSGLVFMVASKSLSNFLGLGAPWILVALGAGLLGFAVFVAYTATRATIDLREVRMITIGDVGWVVGSIALVATGIFSSGGVVTVLVIADVVLLFAILQVVGVRRLRSAPVEVQRQGV